MTARAWFYGPQGFGSTRGSFPTSATVAKTDAAMARTDAGLCPWCAAPVNEDGGCDVCREEGQRCDCDPPEESTVPQSVKDARAAAETLLLNGQLGPIHTTLALPAFAAIFGYESAADHARLAAHVAFQAVPGLR